MTDVLDIYAANASALADRYDALDTGAVLAPVLDLLPSPPVRVLDIGAGSGRDAAWLAGRGYRVTAAEPVAAFRDTIARRDAQIAIRDAGLPELAGLDGVFDIVLIAAVWHHLPPGDRDRALARCVDLMGQDARLILSLRHGPLPEGQPIHAADTETEIARAAAAGLTVLRAAEAPDAATPAGNISWTWLVCERAEP